MNPEEEDEVTEPITVDSQGELIAGREYNEKYTEINEEEEKFGVEEDLKGIEITISVLERLGWIGPLERPSGNVKRR